MFTCAAHPCCLGLNINTYIVMQDMQRPLYMQPRDAMEYGVIDAIVRNETSIIDTVMSPEQWDKEAGLVAKPAPAQ